jgi:hypothetical protein
MKRACFAAALIGALTASTNASAQDADETWARAEENRVYLDFDVWPFQQAFFGDINIVAMGFAAVGQIELVDHVYLDAEIPWGVLTAEGAGQRETRGVFGNITLGAHYADTATDNIAWWAGGTLSVPTMLMSDPEVDQVLVASSAVAARGLYDAHRFFPEVLSLRPGGGVELKFGIFRYRGDLRLANHIPLDGQDFELFMEQGNEGEVRADFGLGGGLRFQEVFTWTEDDLVQTALEPFVGYEPPGSGFLARFGVMLALDESLGPFPDQGKVAAFRFTLGGKW